MESIVEVDNIFGTGGYEVWEDRKFLCHNAVNLWACGAIPVIGPVCGNRSVYCNDVIETYHDFGKSVVQVRSVPTFNQVAFGEDVEAVCSMMVVVGG